MLGQLQKKLLEMKGYINTISAGGTVNALKNLIINSSHINKKSKIAYFCGDNVSYDLDIELKQDGIEVYKIINYFSKKITDLSVENKKNLRKSPTPHDFVYSSRSALSFIELVKKYSLYRIMTESKVMCISKKVAEIFSSLDWKKVKIFNPGEELLKIKEEN